MFVRLVLVAVAGSLALGAPAAAQGTAVVSASARTVSAQLAPIDRYRARAREAIRPILEERISDEDKANIKAAAAATSRGDLAVVNDLKARIANPTGRKLVDWYRLQRGLSSPQEARAFLSANPNWPDEDTIRRRMEEALFQRPLTPDEVFAVFAKEPPAYGAGRAALALAHLARGEKEAARRLAATAWRGDQIPDALEPVFLERLGSLLTGADHKWRLDVILGEDERWSSERRERTGDAVRLVPLLPESERDKARARIAVYRRDKSAGRLMQAVLEGKSIETVKKTTRKPKKKGGTEKKAEDKDTAQQEPTGANAEEVAARSKAATSDWGLQFQYVQLLRRENKRAAAASILKRAPVDPSVIANLDGWWAHREAVALDMIAAGDAKGAYAIVRDAGPLSVNPAKDQAFMAGNLALRYLKDKAAAIRHFTAMRKAADGPLSRAKSEYWLARAHAAAGNGDAAAEHYKRGAVFLDTFDGQLSRLAANPDERRLAVPLPEAVTDSDIARFLARDEVRAARLALLSGYSRRNVMTFFARLSHRLTSEAELAMLGELARSLDDPQIAVRLGKAAVARGRNLYIYAYPTDVLPEYTPLRQPPEPAMLLGIGRQETEFNSDTKSGAGARGLLQVMPVTARHVCHDYAISCNVPKLMTDASYNLQLAAAYIADRTDQFDGSYILTLTGYNAGPGRTREWLNKLGDPRGKVDPIDWIYRIPFEETRLYVQKVLANVQMYRALLGEKEPLQLDLDLKRTKNR